MKPIVKCQIIGILEDGPQSLSQQAIDYLKTADLLIGSPRFIDAVQGLLKDEVKKQDFTGKIMQVPNWVQTALEQNKQVVVLATGDPLCHGIGSFIVKKLGIENCNVLPNITMFQVAFSRLGLAWQAVKISSIHSNFEHGMRDLLSDCRTNDMIACYTSPQNSPVRIAKMLSCENMQDQFEMLIASRLTTDDEQLTGWLAIDEVITQPNPNLVILKRIKPIQNNTLFGLEDAEYMQRKPNKGLITKQEVRAVSLAKLQLRHNSIVWDIGAGSGSIGLEAAHLCPKGRVYAIEKNTADFEIILQNLAKSSLSNYHVEQGKAPDGLDAWENADAIFIGGSGGNLADLIELCLSRLNIGGTLVMNFVTIENLNVAIETLKQLKNVQWHFIQMQISRSKPILNMQRLEAENPVFIISASMTLV
ncbi:bifunctional cobalt-precorrin-7 (C(5))-methyltransferase/cobalt-precorrin-6B (C(15))-methyltransferase [Candidatus Marithrix sp. Canyon 246]|uniref:bifunctional cobalt-precorrin-7 (C(5))-methyltransferase/cobalt-precorrin-6B (C(15))-methyltransferase n=1 Tax=Candidatus Marithrix sp. Canyon 246 TaxID=1827136 RepID=UPI00084A2572|nr:bifunctional cobalt-precorrin-7 (C(5))-methyltransferase/cobalt-precorrin-6B (C(15))-methyltransferase [Candidatus Marithrix sp. Canyon 246]